MDNIFISYLCFALLVSVVSATYSDCGKGSIAFLSSLFIILIIFQIERLKYCCFFYFFPFLIHFREELQIPVLN